MSIKEFFKPNFFKIILTILLFISAILWLNHQINEREGLLGLRYNPYLSIYENCCNTSSKYYINNESFFEKVCVITNPLKNMSCDEIKIEVDKTIEKNKIIEKENMKFKIKFYIISALISYMLSSLIYFIYDKIKNIRNK